jgi:hypothetical protein
MTSDSDTAGAAQFLSRAEVSEIAQAILDEDRAEMGRLARQGVHIGRGEAIAASSRGTV